LAANPLNLFLVLVLVYLVLSLLPSTPPPPPPPPLPSALRRYKLDSTFLHLPASEVLALLQTSLDKVRTEVDRLEEEKQKCDEGMEGLKKELYAKFGNSINLERGD
ncbi:hypothetical protein JCM1841_000023, partial [Sporobolomyces salmonicolor]